MPRTTWYSVLAAAVIVVLFLALSAYMIFDLAVADQKLQYQWDRALSIYNGLQALAAAAAGVLLGTSVQQANVRAADARADAAKTGADKANAAKAVMNSLPPPGEAPLNDGQKLAQLRAILS